MLPFFFILLALTLATSAESARTIRRFEPTHVNLSDAARYLFLAGMFDSVLQTWSTYEHACSAANDEATKTCPAQHKPPEMPTPHDFLWAMISPLNVLQKFGDAAKIPFPFFEQNPTCLGQRISRFISKNPALTVALCVFMHSAYKTYYCSAFWLMFRKFKHQETQTNSTHMCNAETQLALGGAGGLAKKILHIKRPRKSTSPLSPSPLGYVSPTSHTSSDLEYTDSDPEGRSSPSCMPSRKRT